VCKFALRDPTAMQFIGQSICGRGRRSDIPAEPNRNKAMAKRSKRGRMTSTGAKDAWQNPNSAVRDSVPSLEVLLV
jgi:hypothetical protein